MFFLHCSKDNKLIYFHLQYVVFVPVTGGGLTDAIPRILHPGRASRKDWADKRRLYWRRNRQVPVLGRAAFKWANAKAS